MKMLFYRLPLLLVLLVSFNHANAQPKYINMGNKELVAASLKRNTTFKEVDIPRSAILSEVMVRMEGSCPASLGVDARNDRESVEVLQNVQIPSIQRSALKPYYDEICLLLSEEDKDIPAMAALFTEAKVAEEKATANAYTSLLAGVSESAAAAIKSIEAEMKTGVGFSYETDWVSVAAEVPEFALATFQRLCDRHNGRYDDNGLSEAWDKFQKEFNTTNDNIVRHN